MPNDRNFLIGYGERLTEHIPPTPGGQPKAHPYSYDEAAARLAPLMQSMCGRLDELPDAACPNDEAVAIVTLHPTYIAKSYFPTVLLRDTGLRTVGSRPALVKPAKWNKKGEPCVSSTVDLFVAGRRSAFRSWCDEVTKNASAPDWAGDFIKIESLRGFASGERMRGVPLRWPRKRPFRAEIALHTWDSAFALEGFAAYLHEIGLRANFDSRIETRGLCFLPADLTLDQAADVEKFAFLRVLRRMPKLRSFDPVLRVAPGVRPIECSLPDADPIDPTLRMAVFDGGLTPQGPMKRWASSRKSDGLGKRVPEYVEHGSAVTSAALFGPIRRGVPVPAPFGYVDHYRVLDSNTDPNTDLFDVLNRILDVLSHGQHSFCNLSLGPSMPIEDDEVHVWTAKLDEVFAKGDHFTTVAVGNDGAMDRASGLARIQVPADCVNAVAVGAADTLEARWRRAPYSSVGPGRSPGIVKPDLMCFGGVADEPFFVVDPSNPALAIPVTGTSFSAPALLRLAAGVRSHFGALLSPLAIKGLLIHRATDDGHSRTDVGWGRVLDAVDGLVTCGPGSATVVYQGTLEAGRYVRARIPMPKDAVGSKVSLSATFCFACDVDPQDPSNYTRSGLEVTFRPDARKKSKAEAKRAKSGRFFRQRPPHMTEAQLRSDVHKWETVLHDSRSVYGSSLYRPVFDIHYNARALGQPDARARSIPYALVLTVEIPKMPELYDMLLARYRTQLEALQPVIEVPIRAQV